MSPKRSNNRNDLFLVRFWIEDTGSESQGKSVWGGRVQRTVSGESHEFNDWDELVKALREMLAATSPMFLVDHLPEKNANTASESDKGGTEQ